MREGVVPSLSSSMPDVCFLMRRAFLFMDCYACFPAPAIY